MEEKIYVSVIIPVYNRRELIKRCLNSVSQNTLPQKLYEVIVVDDFSTDGTREFLKDYKGILNYHVIFRDTNSGTASIPRNEGMQKAKGEYIYFIDSDDYITEETLKEGLEFGLSNSSDIVCLSYFSDKRTVASSMYKSTINDVVLEKTTLINNLGSGNKFINRKIIIDYNIVFPTHIRVGEDTLFMIKCYAVASKISILVGKFYYVEAATGDNLTNIRLNIEDVVYCIIHGIDFIFTNVSQIDRKRNIISLFVNRMLDKNHKKLKQDNINTLYNLEDKYGIFSQIVNNPLLSKTYVIQGILRKDINYIKTISKYIELQDFKGKIKIKEGKAYVQYIYNNISEYIDISYINPISVYVTNVSYNNLILSIEFYIFNAFFPQKNKYDIFFMCSERVNDEKFICYDVVPLELYKNKYIVNIDLSYMCLYLEQTIDFYIHYKDDLFCKKVRVGKNIISSHNSQHVLKDHEVLYVNNKIYKIVHYKTQGGYLAVSITTD